MHTTQKRELSMWQISLFIGVTLIIMAIASGIAYGYLHPTIFQADSQTFSPERLQPTLTLLRFEILLWLVVIAISRCLGTSFIYAPISRKPLTARSLVATDLYSYFSNVHRLFTLDKRQFRK